MTDKWIAFLAGFNLFGLLDAFAKREWVWFTALAFVLVISALALLAPAPAHE